MGRLTLNVLLSFAQFEREVIGERVRDKIAASKRLKLVSGIGLGLLFGETLSEPLKELSLAGDQNPVRLRPGEAHPGAEIRGTKREARTGGRARRAKAA
jgi:hypothetical protein